jgi:ABC-2 type transport system permease protein
MKIRNLCALTRSEVKGYMVSPAAYVFVIIFLLLSGFFTFMMSNFFQAGEASLRAFFFWHPWLYLVLVPAIGMHLWADERRLGTVELLFTMPVTIPEAIISKFISAWFFVAAALAMTFPIVYTVYYLGSPDTGTIICGYIGSFLLAGTYLSAASFTSSITRSQVVSFILSAIICLFLILAGWPPVTDMLVEWAPVEVISAVASCSVMPHFDNMQRGIIDLRDIVYFSSVIFFFLFLTGIVLKNHRGG